MTSTLASMRVTSHVSGSPFLREMSACRLGHRVFFHLLSATKHDAALADWNSSFLQNCWHVQLSMSDQQTKRWTKRNAICTQIFHAANARETLTLLFFFHSVIDDMKTNLLSESANARLTGLLGRTQLVATDRICKEHLNKTILVRLYLPFICCDWTHGQVNRAELR